MNRFHVSVERSLFMTFLAGGVKEAGESLWECRTEKRWISKPNSWRFENYISVFSKIFCPDSSVSCYEALQRRLPLCNSNHEYVKTGPQHPVWIFQWNNLIFHISRSNHFRISDFDLPLAFLIWLWYFWLINNFENFQGWNYATFLS